MEDLPVIACDPPLPAEIGDEWICPECARKFHFVLLQLEDEEVELGCWFTTEIGI